MRTILTSLCCFASVLTAVCLPVASAGELPAETLARLEKLMQPAAAAVLREHRDVQGGPGLSRETAWVLLRKDPSAVSQQYQILRMLLPGRSDSQALVHLEGKYYDVHTYSFENEEGELCELKLWFDITAYFSHSYDEE